MSVLTPHPGHANATVVVNDQSTYRKGEYFWKELSINNGNAAVWQGVTNVAWLTGTTNTDTGSIFHPKTPEAFSHDADGNLTNDGHFNYTWDAENRLLKAESISSSPTASRRNVQWAFDSKGRRIRQVTSDGSSGSYVVTEDLKFLYDGWSCQADLNATNNTIIRTYLWGLDLSGNMTGAGGVGGLLAVSTVNPTSSTHFTAYEGNGNVAALVSSGGTRSATYAYEPFGRTIRTSGSASGESSYRFSTKRGNDAAKLVMYEYRVYNPSTARWLSRDPIHERGGLNLFQFVRAAPVNALDPTGMDTFI